MNRMTFTRLAYLAGMFALTAAALHLVFGAALAKLTTFG